MELRTERLKLLDTPRKHKLNGEQIMDNDKKDICTIRIIFPVESDEKAIDAKKKIVEVLSDIEGVQIHFALMPTPARPPMG